MKIQKVYYSGCFIEISHDLYAFQKRDSVEGISGPGIISTFGGRIEDGEKALDTIQRELKEELELSTETKSFRYVGYFERYDETMCHFVGCTYFYIKCDKILSQCNEGELVFLHKDNIIVNSDVGNVTKEMFYRISMGCLYQ